MKYIGDIQLCGIKVAVVAASKHSLKGQVQFRTFISELLKIKICI